MNAFAAESAAWRIKAIGHDIASDARQLELSIKCADASDIQKRLASIRRLITIAENLARDCETAMNTKDAANV